MKPPIVRLTPAILAIAAVAVTGCVGDGRAARDSGSSRAAPPSQQTPDPERTQDLVALTTAQGANVRAINVASSRA